MSSKGPMILPVDLGKRIDVSRPQHHVPKAAVPSMGQVSNRRFIQRMEDWGWIAVKTNNGKTLMSGPTDDVYVMAADAHNRNPLSVFKAVLDGCNGISWESFWTTNIPAEVDQWLGEMSAVLDAEDRKEREREEARRQKEQRRREREEEQRRMAAPSQPARVINLDTQTDVTEELQALEAEVTEEREHRVRVQPRVLALLVESGEPWAISEISKHLGINNDSSVSGACGRLMQSGLVKRVAHGVYQAVRTGGDHKVHISVGGGPEIAAAAPMAPVVAPAPEIPAAARTAPPSAPSDTRQAPMEGEDQWEETINEVLDLMFPNGFKARHLPLIDRWRQATMALMRELQD